MEFYKKTGVACCYSITQFCQALCNPMDCSMLGFPDLQVLLEFVQIHVHCVEDAIQPPHPPLPSSSPVLNHSQYQHLFQWVSSLHQVTKVLELQLQHQSFQLIFSNDNKNNSCWYLLSTYTVYHMLCADSIALRPGHPQVVKHLWGKCRYAVRACTSP